MNLAEEDREKTTFVSHMGAHRYLRMLFGLRNVPASFQRALDMILTRVRWQTCLIYLDDVIISSKDEKKHLEDVNEVLHLLGDAGISLKLKNCEFSSPSLTTWATSSPRESVCCERQDAGLCGSHLPDGQDDASFVPWSWQLLSQFH